MVVVWCSCDSAGGIIIPSLNYGYLFFSIGMKFCIFVELFEGLLHSR